MPKRIYRVALLAVLMLTVGASGAQAEPFTLELEADYQAALTWWGVSTPPQCASVTREVLTVADLTLDEVEGHSGGANMPLPGETNVACFLDLYEPNMSLKYPTACEREALMRHEVGHLLGYDDDNNDPHSIMSPVGLHSACPNQVEELRWRHMLQFERCISLPASATKHQRQYCWARSRRTLHRLLAAAALRR
jgi:hypothetical protein